MKRIIYIIPFLFLFNFSHAQFKNYKIENGKVKIEKMFSDFTTLTITQSSTKQVDGEKETKAQLFNDLTGFVVDKIAKIPSYISQYLKNRKKKFTANYEAKNTLECSSTTYKIDKITFKRDFFSKTSTNAINAMYLELEPTIVQDKKFIAFKVKKLDYDYSKAKVKTKAPFINLLVEIKVFYAKPKENNTLEKTEMKSSSIIIPVDLRKKKQDVTLMKNKLSDVFLPNGITEISVSITEINPYKLKLEALESFLNDNKDDLSGLFGELSKLLKKE
jgi:hypothetical protein